MLGGQIPISLGRAITSLDHVWENHRSAKAFGGRTPISLGRAITFLDQNLINASTSGGRAPISLGRAIISLDHVGENHSSANALGGAGSTPRWQGYDFLYRL